MKFKVGDIICYSNSCVAMVLKHEEFEINCLGDIDYDYVIFWFKEKTVTTFDRKVIENHFKLIKRLKNEKSI